MSYVQSIPVFLDVVHNVYIRICFYESVPTGTVGGGEKLEEEEEVGRELWQKNSLQARNTHVPVASFSTRPSSPSFRTRPINFWRSLHSVMACLTGRRSSVRNKDIIKP